MPIKRIYYGSKEDENGKHPHLCDELTGNLDTQNTRAIVVIAHNVEVASEEDRIIHIRDGQVEREEYASGGVNL